MATVSLSQIWQPCCFLLDGKGSMGFLDRLGGPSLGVPGFSILKTIIIVGW
jgi:hypothetical protein